LKNEDYNSNIECSWKSKQKASRIIEPEKIDKNKGMVEPKSESKANDIPKFSIKTDSSEKSSFKLRIEDNASGDTFIKKGNEVSYLV